MVQEIQIDRVSPVRASEPSLPFHTETKELAAQFGQAAKPEWRRKIPCNPFT